MVARDNHCVVMALLDVKAGCQKKDAIGMAQIDLEIQLLCH